MALGPRGRVTDRPAWGEDRVGGAAPPNIC